MVGLGEGLPGAWDEVPEHPGQQCHEAHPHRPHRVPLPVARTEPPAAPPPPPRGMVEATAASRPVSPPAPRTDGALVDEATALVLLGSDPWTRFDTWATRAWQLAERAIDAAKEEGERNAKVTLGEEVRYDPRASNLMDAARLCSELAQAVCPLSALTGLPSRLPEIELEIPTL